MTTASREASEVTNPDFGPLLRSDLRNRAIANTIELERAEIFFEPIALTILGTIYDLGHVTCDALAQHISTPDEWIWFSRLQRARLVQDVGTGFSLAREGRDMVERILAEAESS